MKKILISVLIVLLLLLVVFSIWKGIPFLKISSISDIKNASNNLDSDIEKANELSGKTYPESTQTLNDAIKNLKLAKQEYESKNPYNSEQLNIGALEVKTYKIHYLWTILGNYRKDKGVKSLTLDLKSTTSKDVYDLQFTLIGEYIPITDFLYAIEDDEELKFEIKELTILSSGSAAQSTSTNTTNSSVLTNKNTTKNTTNTSSQTTTTTKSDGTTLQATFIVKNIGITLD